jgi:NOL1/NOP2/fmu family ribosome biogenesis protein
MPNVVVTQAAPPAFSGVAGLFDVMMVDAPCSGEGMFRKGDTSRQEWSEENAASCSVRQRHILRDSWAALKEGGWLIYSTCTFNPAENEENLQWLLRKFDVEVIPLEVPDNWGVDTLPLASGNALRFMPHKVKGEGFFVALLRKKSYEKAARFPKNPKQKTKVPTVIRDLVRDPDYFSFREHDDKWSAFPLKYRQFNDLLQKKLNLFHAGLPLGSLVRRDLVPAHELTMNVEFMQKRFSEIELPRYEALRYLKGEVPQVPVDLPRGFVLPTFNHIPLGFLKNVGSRFNNLYPKNWRIRMSIDTK